LYKVFYFLPSYLKDKNITTAALLHVTEEEDLIIPLALYTMTQGMIIYIPSLTHSNKCTHAWKISTNRITYLTIITFSYSDFSRRIALEDLLTKMSINFSKLV